MALQTDQLKWLRTQLVPNRTMLVLLLLGLLLIGGIDFLLVQSFKRDQQYRQNLMAQQLQAQIQASLEEHVTALLGLNVVYQNFVDITPYDFQQYGQSITENLDGFRGLFYVDAQNTVRQVYPYTPDNRSLLGLKITKPNPLAPLLEKARTTRKPATSGLMSFGKHPRSLLAVTPIFRNGREFLGYALGEISLESIWNPFSHADFLETYQIQLLDPTGLPFFQRTGTAALLDNGSMSTRLPFNVLDKQWSLLLHPKIPLDGKLMLQRLSLWGTGLLMLMLVLLLINGSRRHKAAIQDAQKQFELIFKASPDGILLLDDKLQFNLTNEPVRQWAGLNEQELAQKRFFDLFTCQCPHLQKCRDLDFLLCTSDQFNEALPETLETQITHAEDHSVRTLRLNASRITETQGGFICVLGDISTGKELERVKETYVATLTHDLKTPLLAQNMVLETVLSGGVGTVTAQQQELLHGAQQSVADLVEMVDSTLLFYKLESSHLPMHRSRLPITGLLKEVMEILQPFARRRDIGFELESAVDLPNIWVDPVQIKRVFHNILSNAISYGSKGDPIRVSLQVSPQQADELPVLTIQIENRGQGIQPEDLPRIFDKYYSLSRKFKRIGSGLGLYISRRIVELHGGKIWAESTPGESTRFFISLPCPQEVA